MPSHKKVHVRAVRTRKTKINAWLPNEVLLLLDQGHKLIIYAGWTILGGTVVEAKLLTKSVMIDIHKDWTAQSGKGWKLVVEEVILTGKKAKKS